MIILVGVLVGISCWCLLYGMIWLFRGREARVRARIKEFVVEEGETQATEAQQRRQLRENLFNNLDSRLSQQSILKSTFDTLGQDISKADLHITVTEFILIQVSVSVALALVLLLLLAPVPVLGYALAFIGFLAVAMLSRSYLRFLGKRRVARFEDQLPDTLSILASSVRGGFSLFQALQLIAREANDPAKSEFLRVIQQLSLGAPMDDALGGLARRMPTEDVDILVTAIKLQQQTGGNLAHVLDVVANTVRERHRVEREIRGLTAQQRFSAILLAGLPFLLTGVLFLISPTYIGHLFEWGWVLILPASAIILNIIGLILMRRIASIDV
jgi:tight adherence protein B